MKAFGLGLLLLLVVIECRSAPLWGTTGHAITAQIAQAYVSADSLQQLNYYLANVSGEMYQVASWADQVRTKPAYAWSAPLHYIDVPDWQCSFNPQLNCGDDNDGMCISTAITNFTTQLAGKLGYNTKEVALRFVIHFLGDIHNPLHVGFVSNAGGNTIKGVYFDQSTNLHSVWDTLIISGIIEYAFGGSQTNYVNYLLDQIKGPWKSMAETWAICNSTSEAQPLSCPNEWANESAKLACEYSYTDQSGKKIPNNFDLADPYYQFVRPIVDQQLAKGGIRLASTLNKIWDKK